VVIYINDENYREDGKERTELTISLEVRPHTILDWKKIDQ
jgi:hypothetical protein